MGPGRRGKSMDGVSGNPLLLQCCLPVEQREQHHEVFVQQPIDLAILLVLVFFWWGRGTGEQLTTTVSARKKCHCLPDGKATTIPLLMLKKRGD